MSISAAVAFLVTVIAGATSRHAYNQLDGRMKVSDPMVDVWLKVKPIAGALALIAGCVGVALQASGAP